MGGDSQTIQKGEKVGNSWVYQVIDILSSSYGWSMKYILSDVTLGDLLGFLSAIEQRKRSEYLIALAIAHNPYSEKPNELFRELRGDTISNAPNEMDRNSLGELKEKLKKSNMIRVK